MTKPNKSRHSRRSKNKQISPSTNSINVKKCIIYGLIVLLAAIPFIMGKYIEFNTTGPYDSGGYVYSAKHVLEGAVIGVDERPSAKLGTLLVNMLGVWLFGYSETGPEIIQTLMQASALVLVFIAMRKLFGILPAAVGVIMASTFLSAPLIAKFGNVKEQYMIACMMLGISSFVIYQLRGKWYWAIMAGFFLTWAPLFKETGTSALAAVGLFVALQPLLKNRTLKQTGIDILLLFAGFIIAITPLYIWLEVGGHRGMRPYSFALKPIKAILKSPETKKENQPETQDVSDPQKKKDTDEKGFIQKFLPRYVTGSWEALKTKQRKEVVRRVLRYYKLLLLPIALALASIIARLIRLIMSLTGMLSAKNIKNYEKFVLLFAVWWLLDMCFVWVSPRSYEQYYLPLNASAAMLGGYTIALYWDWTVNKINKMSCIAVGSVGLLLMIVLTWHIFFGIEKSPHSNTNYGAKQRGYIQRLSEAHHQRTKNLVGHWQIVGRYIRMNSQPEDRIYVWGFVDTRKPHFPWDRPPLQLWAKTENGFLPANKRTMETFDKMYSDWLAKNVNKDEALRYKAMQPFREYVMNNFQIVNEFGQHVLFVRK